MIKHLNKEGSCNFLGKVAHHLSLRYLLISTCCLIVIEHAEVIEAMTTSYYANHMHNHDFSEEDLMLSCLIIFFGSHAFNGICTLMKA
ncbi:hypothetical protein AB4K20DRAFT_1882880 [Rhizopus microsporus]